MFARLLHPTGPTAPGLTGTVALVLLLAWPGPILGQAVRSGPVKLFPGEHRFSSPVADPVEPRFGIALLVTDLLRTSGGERAPFTTVAGDKRDVQAAAAIGGTFPLLSLFDRPEGGLTVSAQAGVFARFRVELPSRDDLGQDWIVGMPVEARWNALSGRFRLIHRSAHIGDEFAESTGAQRIEFGGETVDLLVGWRPGNVRFYGGGGWIFHSNTDNVSVLEQDDRPDRFALQAGMDGSWRPWSDPRFLVLAGADYQAAERTRWKRALALAGGLEFRSAGGRAQLVFRLLDGVSPMGQFFLTQERYTSLELVLGF